MRKNISTAHRVFLVINAIILAFIAFLCLFPFINLLAISFSKASYVEAGLVSFLPKGFNVSAYKYVLSNKRFWTSSWISIKRVLIGVSLNMICMTLTGYALSKSKHEFRGRDAIMWIFVASMMFSGGMIPTYIVIMKLKLLNKIWALVLPCAMHVNNMILLMNFFRGIPNEMEEAARIDGANAWQILVRIVLPVSKPGLATVCLFRIVSHWNSWFDGVLYMTNPKNYPLQSYLRGLIDNFDKMLDEVKTVEELMNMISARTGRAAQIFVATIPIMIIYPFLSRYFTTGLVMGSVKG